MATKENHPNWRTAIEKPFEGFELIRRTDGLLERLHRGIDRLPAYNMALRSLKATEGLYPEGTIKKSPLGDVRFASQLGLYWVTRHLDILEDDGVSSYVKIVLDPKNEFGAISPQDRLVVTAMHETGLISMTGKLVDNQPEIVFFQIEWPNKESEAGTPIIKNSRAAITAIYRGMIELLNPNATANAYGRIVNPLGLSKADR